MIFVEIQKIKIDKKNEMKLLQRHKLIKIIIQQYVIFLSAADATKYKRDLSKSLFFDNKNLMMINYIFVEKKTVIKKI